MRRKTLYGLLKIALIAASLGGCEAPAPQPPAATAPSSTAVAPSPAAVAPGHPPGGYVTAGGHRLWVESEGQGTPLLLVAGGPGMAHDYFHPYFSAVAAERRVLYYDAFGRGRSDRASERAAYSFARDVEEVEALRRALGLESLDLLGHSYGGLVALAYAVEHPEAVRHLVLVSPVLSGEMWQANNDLANRLLQEQLPEVWREVESLRAQGVRASDPALRRIYRAPPGLYFHRPLKAHRELPLAVAPEVYYGILGEDADFVLGEEVAKLDFESRLDRLAMPVLLLLGRYDRLSPPVRAEELRRAVPRARVVVLEQSAHFPFIEETAPAITSIQEFLAG